MTGQRSDTAAGFWATGNDVDLTAPSTSEAQQWQGWGTALKPAFEPVIVARKPIEGTVANNVLKWGTGGLNIDGSRIGTETISTHNAPKGSFAGGEPDRGSDTSSYKEHIGRWPANIILDPYTAELLDEQSGDRPGGNFPTQRGAGVATGFGLGKPTEGGARKMNDSGGASRFFYVAKASKRDRNEGLEGLPIRRPDDRTETGMGTFAEKGVQPAQNFHPTVKPTSLMEYLIKLVTPPNGTVLDPFTGSGSTGKAAILQGFDFIGIEMTEEYLPIIEGRLKHAEQIVAEAKEQDKAKENEVLF
jgi:site-specific DNA-methyltransferase (adenine-specific)